MKKNKKLGGKCGNAWCQKKRTVTVACTDVILFGFESRRFVVGEPELRSGKLCRYLKCPLECLLGFRLLGSKIPVVPSKPSKRWSAFFDVTDPLCLQVNVTPGERYDHLVFLTLQKKNTKLYRFLLQKCLMLKACTDDFEILFGFESRWVESSLITQLWQFSVALRTLQGRFHPTAPAEKAVGKIFFGATAFVFLNSSLFLCARAYDDMGRRASTKILFKSDDTTSNVS